MKKENFILRKFSQVFTACLMVPALSFMAASCSDDDDKPDPNEISDLTGVVTLAADQAENTATVTFTAKSTWEAIPANEESKWFTFTPASGAAGNATITISAPYNDGAAKTGKLTIKHGTKNYEVTINQSAGVPDVAVWKPESLYDVTQFSPDTYNATEDMPAEFSFTVTTKQDYESLDNAPFEIFTFYTDETMEYAAKDSLIHWVEFKIADNSPVAKEGKKITLTVKPHEEFKQNGAFYEMNPRYAFIVIAPKGTQVKDMFANGALKDEYKGASIEQAPYTLKHSMEMGMLMVPGGTLDVTERNFKEFGIVMYNQAQTETINWLQAMIDGDHVTLSASSGHMGEQGLLVFTAYRGSELKPLELKHLKPTSVFCMQP